MSLGVTGGAGEPGMIPGSEWPSAFEWLPSADDPYVLAGGWFRLVLGPIALPEAAATFSPSVPS